MNHSKSKWMVITLTLAIIMVIGGCKKKAPVAPPPPPPPPPAPTASITANPNDIQPGQSSQLTWSTENATDVSIDGIGKVDPKGTKTVNPTDSTSYRLVATGPGGTQEATARVTVTQPPPPQAPPPTYTPTDEQLLAQNVKDIFFDYDSFEIRPGDQQSLPSGARFLTGQKPNWKIQIEGYCDERGSTEYNLALGDSRANAAKRALVAAGVAADRIRTISFGKEKPFCTESNEQCWQQNRRAHFALQK